MPCELVMEASLMARQVSAWQKRQGASEKSQEYQRTRKSILSLWPESMRRREEKEGVSSFDETRVGRPPLNLRAAL